MNAPSLALACVLLLTACASTSPAGVDARIHNLAKQEQSLRASVVQLEERQRSLRHEIAIAQTRAEQARCEAKRDEYRATTAALLASYSMRYAESKACKADAAKEGGFATVLGCGLGILVTGGWGALICGGSFVAGQMAGESCTDAPQLPSKEQLEREALAQLGLQSPPRCDRGPRTLTSPYGSTTASAPPGITGVMQAPPTATGLIGTGRGAPAAPTSAPPAPVATSPAPAAQPPPVDPAVEAARRRREAERAREAKRVRDKAAAEDRARVRAAQMEAEWAREKALMKSRRRAKKK